MRTTLLSRALLVLLATGALSLSACGGDETDVDDAMTDDAMMDDGMSDDATVVDDDMAPVDGLVDSMGTGGMMDSSATDGM